MKKFISLGFQGDYHELTLEEVLQEIRDIAENDCSGYEYYIETNNKEKQIPSIDEYANIRVQWAKEELEKGYEYEYCGVKYNELNDEIVEEIWDDLKNIAFIETLEKDIILDEDWFAFDKGTERDEIWAWFNENHSLGIHNLIYEYERKDVIK